MMHDRLVMIDWLYIIVYTPYIYILIKEILKREKNVDLAQIKHQFPLEYKGNFRMLKV